MTVPLGPFLLFGLWLLLGWHLSIRGRPSSSGAERAPRRASSAASLTYAIFVAMVVLARAGRSAGRTAAPADRFSVVVLGDGRRGQLAFLVPRARVPRPGSPGNRMRHRARCWCERSSRSSRSEERWSWSVIGGRLHASSTRTNDATPPGAPAIALWPSVVARACPHRSLGSARASTVCGLLEPGDAIAGHSASSPRTHAVTTSSRPCQAGSASSARGTPSRPGRPHATVARTPVPSSSARSVTLTVTMNRLCTPRRRFGRASDRCAAPVRRPAATRRRRRRLSPPRSSPAARRA